MERVREGWRNAERESKRGMEKWRERDGEMERERVREGWRN